MYRKGHKKQLYFAIRYAYAVCAKEIRVRMAPKLRWPLFLLLQHELEYHVPQPLPVHHRELRSVDKLFVTVPLRTASTMFVNLLSMDSGVGESM